MMMGESSGNNDEDVIMVKADELISALSCCLCNQLFDECTTITECMHKFCKQCIYDKFTKEHYRCCPKCDIFLGANPETKLRKDNNMTNLRLKLFPMINDGAKESSMINTPTVVQSKGKEISLSSNLVDNLPKLTTQEKTTKKRSPKTRIIRNANPLQAPLLIKDSCPMVEHPLQVPFLIKEDSCHKVDQSSHKKSTSSNAPSSSSKNVLPKKNKVDQSSHKKSTSSNAPSSSSKNVLPKKNKVDQSSHKQSTSSNAPSSSKNLLPKKKKQNDKKGKDKISRPMVTKVCDLNKLPSISEEEEDEHPSEQMPITIVDETTMTVPLLKTSTEKDVAAAKSSKMKQVVENKHFAAKIIRRAGLQRNKIDLNKLPASTYCIGESSKANSHVNNNEKNAFTFNGKPIQVIYIDDDGDDGDDSQRNKLENNAKNDPNYKGKEPTVVDEEDEKLLRLLREISSKKVLMKGSRQRKVVLSKQKRLQLRVTPRVPIEGYETLSFGSTRPQGARMGRPVWFYILASTNPEEGAPLPQLPSKFLHSWDDNGMALHVMKYIAYKLYTAYNLIEDAGEIELFMRGNRLSPGLRFRSLREIWCVSSSMFEDHVTTMPPAENFLITLYYAKRVTNSPHQVD